jgi:hypothetical protein
LQEDYNRYTVVKIIFTINSVTYTKYFPIPFSENDNIWFVSAPNYIYYDSTGTNPKYNISNENIKIFEIPTEQQILNSYSVIDDIEDENNSAKVISSETENTLFTNTYVKDSKTILDTFVPPPTISNAPIENLQYSFYIKNSNAIYYHPIVI